MRDFWVAKKVIQGTRKKKFKILKKIVDFNVYETEKVFIHIYIIYLKILKLRKTTQKPRALSLNHSMPLVIKDYYNSNDYNGLFSWLLYNIRHGEFEELNNNLLKKELLRRFITHYFTTTNDMVLLVSIPETILEKDAESDIKNNKHYFLAKQPDFNNNIENAEADFFNSVPSVEFDAPSTDSPMNFNFNYLLDNSIDNKTTPTANLTKDYSNFSKYDSGFTKKSSFSDANKSLNDDEDDNLVVPSDGKFFTCSEIWDRITSNPKLSDVDLDNLCMELKTKARCSERGVLIKEEDLNKALLDHES